MLREIVQIDEEKCDGCGECVPACHEGALKVVDGKVKLLADHLCDGLGDCLGECPRGAIRIDRREADDFDEDAVAVHLKQRDVDPSRVGAVPISPSPGGGCPSNQFVQLDPGRSPGQQDHQGDATSQLSHWPVQLRLLSPSAPVLRGARLLLSADCVPVAFPNFHQKLLQGKAVAVACPKLDNPQGYIEKLSEMIRINDLQDITVAHMQVPCCSGLLMMALEARRASGKSVPLTDMVIGVQGEVLARREVPDEVAAPTGRASA